MCLQIINFIKNALMIGLSNFDCFTYEQIHFCLKSDYFCCQFGLSFSALSMNKFIWVIQARRYGVRAAMPGFIACKLCPDLIFVPTNFRKYTYYSELTRKGEHWNFIMQLECISAHCFQFFLKKVLDSYPLISFPLF